MLSNLTASRRKQLWSLVAVVSQMLQYVLAEREGSVKGVGEVVHNAGCFMDAVIIKQSMRT